MDDTLRLLVDAWSQCRPAEGVEERVAEDAERGPEHLVRILQALEISAQQTGGTLTRAIEQLNDADDAVGALHHMVELIHDAGAPAALSMARQLDARTRSRVLALLRFYWQSPRRSLERPLQGSEPRQRNLWRS